MKAKKVLLCIGCSIIMLTACGGEYVGLTEGDAVSGSAVSGGAVSEGAVNDKVAELDAVSGSVVENEKEEKQDMSSHRFCTDTNMYYVEYGKYNDYPRLMQARTDGTHQKCIKEWKDVYIIQLLYVDENWLNYVIKEYEEEHECRYFTYRVPIKKNAQGYDVVQIQKAEKFLKAGKTSPMYVDSDYYFYDDWVTGKLIKYDLKKNKKDSEATEYGEEIYRGKDFYFLVDVYNKMFYVQKIDSAKWKKVSIDMNEDAEDADDVDNENEEDLIAQGEEAFFYPSSYVKEEEDWVDIHRFDGEKEEKFITWEQLNHAVKEAAGTEKLDICHVTHLFVQNGRLYIQMLTGWYGKKTYQMGYMIFSEETKGDALGLRYERGITECMKSHVKERNGKLCDGEDVFVEHMVFNHANCIAMVDGKAYLSLFDYEKHKGQLGCYDLDTGASEWVSEKDEAYYKLGYDGNLDTFKSVFSDHAFNKFVGDDMPLSNDEYVREFLAD
ncbi:MAG: hypothetical protein NC293_01575 [Roseburia sp.]|nr:hypothetical protein [Roseburia sp.]